jgi:hypothetical protein
VAQFLLRHPGSLDRRRTALIFIILDLAIQALKTFGGNDLFGLARSP